MERNNEVRIAEKVIKCILTDQRGPAFSRFVSFLIHGESSHRKREEGVGIVSVLGKDLPSHQ